MRITGLGGELDAAGELGGGRERPQALSAVGGHGLGQDGGKLELVVDLAVEVTGRLDTAPPRPDADAVSSRGQIVSALPLRCGTMACMAATGPGEGLARLDALITPDLWSRVDGTNRAAVVGWGTMLNVVHLVRGIHTLHAAGQCHAAVPLLRSVMEYTLGTIWLADAGDEAVDVFNRRLQNSHGKLLADLGDRDLEARFPAEAVRTFRDTLAAQLPAHPDERLAAFRHLLAEFGFEQMIPVYNVLSGITHLSLEGAQTFFQDKDGAIRLSRQPFRGEAVPCEEICLGMQFAAMLAYNQLLTDQPWTAELAVIAKDHGLSTKPTVRKSKQRSAE
jgi:hypothetical protein